MDDHHSDCRTVGNNDSIYIRKLSGFLEKSIQGSSDMGCGELSTVPSDQRLLDIGVRSESASDGKSVSIFCVPKGCPHY